MKIKNKYLSLNKSVIILSLCALFLIISGGITYAYFTASVSGNDTAKAVEITTGTMALKLDGTTITSLNNAYPGAYHTIKFSVENTGTLPVTYSLTMIDVENTFVNNELIYSISSTNSGGSINSAIAPLENTNLITNITIQPDVIQEYTMTLHFKETGSNQNSNQGALFSGKVQIINLAENVPNEYTKLSYLKSSGTQYINTGYKANNNTKTESAFLATATGGFLYGSRTSLSANDAHAYFIDSWTVYPMFSAQQSSVSYKISTNTIYTTLLSSEGGYFNGQKLKSFSNSTFNSTLDMYLFALNSNGSLETRTFKGNIYYFKIYEGNNLLKYFIPARRNSDNVYGMYEVVEQKFYTNQGSGTFTGV